MQLFFSVNHAIIFFCKLLQHSSTFRQTKTFHLSSVYQTYSTDYFWSLISVQWWQTATSDQNRLLISGPFTTMSTTYFAARGASSTSSKKGKWRQAESWVRWWMEQKKWERERRGKGVWVKEGRAQSNGGHQLHQKYLGLRNSFNRWISAFRSLPSLKVLQCFAIFS